MNNIKNKKGHKSLASSKQVSFLTDWSSKDKPWDRHRHDAERMQSVLEGAKPGEDWILRQAERVGVCSPSLEYLLNANETTGEVSLTLNKAHFCRVRTCPVCQWRRSLMWLARFHQGMPAATAKHPTGQWVFLTLTVKNCKTEDIKSTLSTMGKAWQRLTQRKSGPFKAVLGWIRTVEITRSKIGEAHPHFHALLFVRPSYFGKDFTTTQEWAEQWQSALGANYLPVVDVRKVRSNKKTKAGGGQALASAGAEVLKYAVKPSDMLQDPDWALEIIRQTFRTRAIASGGVLKNILRTDEESNSDLLLEGEGETLPDEDQDIKMTFDYSRKFHRYVLK